MSTRRRRSARAARPRNRRKLVGTFLLLFVANVIVVFTATNSVPASIAGNNVSDIVANDLKPAECSALDLTNVEGGTLTVTGTAENDLLLGSDVIDTIAGQGGDDCLVGGPGADTLDGGAGTDICLGGGGTDVFLGCETEID